MTGVDPERRRGYIPPYTIQYRGSQQHRFDPQHKDDVRLMLEFNDIEDYPEDFNGEWSDFPRVARLRMNLTALSQHYDLYFVAYKGFVHVYRPNRTVTAILDGPPLAILHPDQSRTPMARYTPGYANRRCPHEVNNMIVGDLGDHEILLLSRDNGEVVAWYTSVIARYVEDRLLHPTHSARSPPCSPRHFFADNVGLSAWGLAIHTKSRLIAVSSNTSEVTVFAFALDGHEDDKKTTQAFTWPPERKLEIISESDTSEEDFRSLGSSQIMDELLTRIYLKFMHRRQKKVNEMEAEDRPNINEYIAKLQTRFQTRQRTWRIVIPLGVEASNLPSVAFCDDEEGNANRIAAVDINGCLFIAEIWTIGSRHLKIPPHNVQYPGGSRYTHVQGWNVFPITDAQLRPTRTLGAAIGLHPSKAVYRGKTNRGAWLDISKCMAEVPNDAVWFEHRNRIIAFERVDFSTDKDGLVAPNPRYAPHVVMSNKLHDPIFDKNDKLDLGADRPVCLAMTIVPPTGDHYLEFSSAEELVQFAGGGGPAKRSLQIPKALSLSEFRGQNADRPDAQHLLRGVSFLRANEADVEILSLDSKQDDCGVVCHHILANINAHQQREFWDMQFGKRCSMLLTIPELNLIVLGSMCGRVALLTLTRPPPRDGARTPRRAFRVDAVLPFDSEERDRERPYVCLLGIAVSPVPETRVQGLELRRRRSCAYGGRRKGSVPEMEPEAPRRWRLILNYQDHTILQYEILRREEDNEWERPNVRRWPRRDACDEPFVDDGNDEDVDEGLERHYFSSGVGTGEDDSESEEDEDEQSLEESGEDVSSMDGGVIEVDSSQGSQDGEDEEEVDDDDDG